MVSAAGGAAANALSVAFLQIVVDLLLQLIDALLVENALADQKHLHMGHRIVGGVALALRFGPIQALVVGQRMRIRANHVRMHEGGASACPAMSSGAHKCRVAYDRIGSVELFEMEIGEAADQARDVAARGLHLYRHRDGVFVVFDDEQNRGSFLLEATFSDSQNSPSLVVPSPRET